MDRVPSRRQFLQTAGVGVVFGFAGCSQSTDPPAQDDTDGAEPSTSGANTTRSTAPTETVEAGSGTPPDAVTLETLATGLGAPLDVVFDPDADRRYVADQAGRILVHDTGGVRDRPALDIRDRIESGGEKGLLGIELHPAFAENRRLFVRYSAPSRSGTPSEFSHTFVLSEFRVDEDGVRVDPDSEQTLLEIPEPQPNHNAGDLAFGPDGYLYVAVGDGGAGGDQGTGHVDDWYRKAGGNGQDVTENLLGSILRLDVDSDEPYAVPDDNPLVGRDGLDEQYAWGFRNPWRMSFDGTDLFVGDVGQGAYEEVSLVEKGGNYGWNVWEGAHCYAADDCPSETPGDVRGGEPLVGPIIEYPHGGEPVSGISVIGGAVYRGARVAGARGVYIFGDFRVAGRLFAATRPDGDGLWPTTTIELAGTSAKKLQQLRSFGRDPDGELYVVGTGSDGGGLFRLAPAE